MILTLSASELRQWKSASAVGHLEKWSSLVRHPDLPTNDSGLFSVRFCAVQKMPAIAGCFNFSRSPVGDPVSSEDHIAAAKTPPRGPLALLGSPNLPGTLFEVILREGDMQDPVTKAEHYRKAASKYGEMAKQAEVDYVAEIYRKVAVRYVFMAEDLLNWSERRREVDVNALAGVFLDRQAA
jgi:hypothetical protein